jgi:glyoxylase-like metal-dependent hydrolase (beta-lactamase superfamily II)
MGDLLFNNMVPYIDWQAGSNTANWIAKLNEVQGWPVDKVIPGHGQLAGKEALKTQAAFLIDLRQEVQQAIDQGKTLEEMKKTVRRPEWLHLDGATMLPIPIEAVYHELKK